MKTKQRWTVKSRVVVVVVVAATAIVATVTAAKVSKARKARNRPQVKLVSKASRSP